MENERLLTINEWLDTIGCDRVYKKDMKETYAKTLPELQAQDAKTRQQVAKEIFADIENIALYVLESAKEGEKYSYLASYILNWGKEISPSYGVKEFQDTPEYQALKSRYLEGK